VVHLASHTSMYNKSTNRPIVFNAIHDFFFHHMASSVDKCVFGKEMSCLCHEFVSFPHCPYLYFGPPQGPRVEQHYKQGG